MMPRHRPLILYISYSCSMIGFNMYIGEHIRISIKMNVDFDFDVKK